MKMMEMGYWTRSVLENGGLAFAPIRSQMVVHLRSASKWNGLDKTIWQANRRKI